MSISPKKVRCGNVKFVCGTIRFHRTDGVESEDAIDHWQGARQLQSGATQLASYDYKAVSTHTGQDPSRTRHGDAGSDLTATLEDYDPQTLYYGSDPGDVSRYASLRQQAKDLASKTFSGQGVDFHRILTRGFHLKLTRQICA